MTDRLPIDEKLNKIRCCVADGNTEDALDHILDLLRGLYCLSKNDLELSPIGLELKAFCKQIQAEVRDQAQTKWLSGFKKGVSCNDDTDVEDFSDIFERHGFSDGRRAFAAACTEFGEWLDCRIPKVRC